ncbi:MAG TPA: Fic family protein [Candidatus Nanoarchaeia archaeon]|nr:Fic family protein [Candidatus Nanoarchaeia archaeon]
MNLAFEDKLYTNNFLDKIAKNISEEEARILYQSNLVESESSDMALMDSFIAWNYAKSNRLKIPNGYVSNIHFLLMRRINRDIAGRYRTVQVVVGDREDTFPPEKIEVAMKEWFMNFKELKDSTEEIKSEHVKFLKIHPFVDGNGRTSRILMNIQNLNSGYGLRLIMKSDSLKEKIEYDYMEWFK